MNPSNEVDTIAYAATFCAAAELLLPHVNSSKLSAPFFTLVGGALENAFKAVLEFRAEESKKYWFHSHDLTRLRKRAEAVGFELAEAENRCVDAISVPHEQFQFRYPQAAGTPVLPSPDLSVAITRQIIGRVILITRALDRLEPSGNKNGPTPP